MTKLRLGLIIIIVLLFLVLATMISGVSLVLYLDIPSFLLVVLLPYLVVSFIYPPSEQIRFNREIFKKEGNYDQGELKKAKSFYSTFKKVIVYNSILWTLMGLIAIGAFHNEYPESLGPNFAVALIVPLYASLVLIILVEPLRASAEKKLTSQ